MKWIVRLALALLLVACGVPEDGSAPETSTTSSSPQSTTTSSLPSVAVPGGFPDGVLADILEDASDRSGVPAAEIEVVSIEPMTFNDASLGCPEPGKMYAQVITPGFVVLLQTGEAQLDYRVAEGGEAFTLCE